MIWEVCPYKRGWAIFDRISRCYVLFGPRRVMEARCRALNAGR